MKNIFSTSSFFKVAFICVLFFGGISFEIKAQNDSTKIIFENALRDIYCITAAKVHKEYSSSADKDYNLNSNLDCDEELKKFEAKITTDSTLSPVMYSILSKENERLENKTDRNTEIINTIIKSNIFPVLEAKYSEKFTATERDDLKSQFDKKINKAVEQIALVEKRKQESINESVNSKQNQSLDTIPIDNDRDMQMREKSVIPKSFQEYALLGSLALGLLNLLLITILFLRTGKIKKTRNSSRSNSISKSDFNNLKERIKELEGKINNTYSKNVNEETESKIPNSVTSKGIPPKKYVKREEITNNPRSYSNQPIKTEIKFAKRPSSSGNVFSQESLFDEDNNDAIYKITITGNTATFVVNSTNSTAMNKAMSNLSDFIDSACESSNSANQGTTIKNVEEQEGKLQLKENVWHIVQKAKIQFV